MDRDPRLCRCRISLPGLCMFLFLATTTLTLVGRRRSHPTRRPVRALSSHCCSCCRAGASSLPTRRQPASSSVPFPRPPPRGHSSLAIPLHHIDWASYSRILSRNYRSKILDSSRRASLSVLSARSALCTNSAPFRNRARHGSRANQARHPNQACDGVNTQNTSIYQALRGCTSDNTCSASYEQQIRTYVARFKISYNSV